MKILLDTHILIWWLAQDPKLTPVELEIIANPDNVIFVSAASAWEISVKKMLGKLDAPNDLPDALATNNFLDLPITIGHTQYLYQLPTHHNDPFDRIMIAQALAEELKFMTRDNQIRRYAGLIFLPK
jgi:PIN domain nuclease of toxin-antitoxin system